jgi:hypothetical protein
MPDVIAEKMLKRMLEKMPNKMLKDMPELTRAYPAIWVGGLEIWERIIL